MYNFFKSVFFSIKLPVIRPPPITDSVTTSDSHSPLITDSITAADSHSPTTIESVTAAEIVEKTNDTTHTDGGVIAAVIGVLLGVLLVVVIGFFFFCWRNKDRKGTFLNHEPSILVSFEKMTNLFYLHFEVHVSQ